MEPEVIKSKDETKENEELLENLIPEVVPADEDVSASKDIEPKALPETEQMFQIDEDAEEQSPDATEEPYIEAHASQDAKDIEEAISAPIEGPEKGGKRLKKKSKKRKEEKPEEAELVPEAPRGLNPTHAKIEAMLFASPKPLTPNDLRDLLDDRDDLSLKGIKEAIFEIQAFYKERAGGFYLEMQKNGGFQFRTRPDLMFCVERALKKRPRPLSRAAQETLSIVAYRQPVTRADIEFIRGVDAGSIIKNLLETEMIACVGRKEIPGKPMLFGTTPFFLKTYGLNTLEDLPSLESFQPRRHLLKLAKGDIKEPENQDDQSALGMES